jgi:hypothetical protein
MQVTLRPRAGNVGGENELRDRGRTGGGGRGCGARLESDRKEIML